jgi:hypothetical protein
MVTAGEPILLFNVCVLNKLFRIEDRKLIEHSFLHQGGDKVFNNLPAYPKLDCGKHHLLIKEKDDTI